MDHELRRQLEPGSNFRLTSLATVQGNACFQKFRPSRPMNRSIDTAATQQRTVRRIHDGIHRKLRDVPLHNFNLYHKTSIMSKF
jgi:hypothetical protein